MAAESTISATSEYQLSSWLFLRSLGICLLLVFASTAVQINGLIGSDGIMPIPATLQLITNGTEAGTPAWLAHPTLFWLNSSDLFLNSVVIAGLLSSLCVTLGVATGPALAVTWITYASICTVGSDFFQFQWEYMLLESIMVAMFLVRWRWLEPPWRSSPYGYSNIALWLGRWLFFRIWFGSAVIKLVSDCTLWRDCTAMNYYYETQLLPAWSAYFVHRLPAWMHSFSAASGILVELIAPFCIFAPRRVRVVGFFVMNGLQLMMFITGNHGFINIITVVLSIFLLDDVVLKRVLPAKLVERFQPAPSSQTPALPALRLIKIVAVSVFIIVSTMQFSITMGATSVLPRSATKLTRAFKNYHLLGAYGLYPQIFTDRAELVIEGSDDGENWKEYTFKYKISDPMKAPPFAYGHQPRLDWRLRFAAVSSPERQPWFYRFLDRLRTGSPQVLQLVDRDPFPDHPPKFVRASVYTYRYTTPDERAVTGEWWKRTRVRDYGRVVSGT